MQQGKGFVNTAVQMDVTLEGLNGVKHTVELGEDDTPAVMRRKVASAVGLPEDAFVMCFGEEVMDEGYDMTQLSAGDTVVWTKTPKYEAIAALHALGETDVTAERLESVEDPEVACLLLQAGVTTAIPFRFLYDTEISLTSFDLSAVSVVTQIGHGFLESCTSLTSVDLSGFIHVTQIGSSFLAECSALRRLDLTPLSRVTQIESKFLYGCSSLCTLDLSPLSRVTHIKFCFLYECTSLESIYLSGCSNVVSSRVRNQLQKLVVEARPKRSRDEPPEESRKRRRHAE